MKNKHKDIVYSWISRILFVIIGMLLVPILFGGRDIPSPQDYIKESDVYLYGNRICVKGGYIVARISNTKSMDPTMDNSSIALIKEIKSLDEIEIGDIIAYNTEGKEIIAHRVIVKKDDYVIVKGDNNIFPDRYKVNEEAIMAVIVGILY